MKTKLTLLAAGALLASASTGLTQQTSLSQVTTGDLVIDSGQFLCCAWGDFHGNGYLDLFVSNWGNGTNDFYRNNGGGSFTKITQGLPVSDGDYHVGAVVGDFENDGNLDLAVSAGAFAPTARSIVLYHNAGTGTFSRLAHDGLANQSGYFGPCACADYDNDGFLDLLVADHGDSSDSGGTNRLFHNNGEGTFTKVVSGPLANDLSLAFDLRWADYDNDGFQDLLIINSWANALNFLYHNNRDGTFTRVLSNAVATDLWSSGANGAAWGDYDNDGFQDLFVTGSDGTTDRLYHNNGDGTFTPISPTPMETRPARTDSFACAWGDYDNDGYLDLFITSHEGNNRLFHNNGDGTFTEILTADPVNGGGPGIYCFACSWADYDKDGFLDLFVTQANDDGSPTSNLLYHNDGNSNSWLEVKLVGLASNHAAIGAKVRAHATISGRDLWQLREINSGGGRWAQPLVAHFGLGDATNVDSLRIEWPSGIVQVLTNIAPRQQLTVIEHQNVSATNNAPKFSNILQSADGTLSLTMAGDPGLLYLFEGSTNLTNWTWLGVRSNANGIIQFKDTHATNYPARFYRASIP